MNENIAASKIQKVFRKYINKTFIDPIYSSETPIKFLIKLPIPNSNNFFIFNIQSLIEWFNISKELINPINNMPFNYSQINIIKKKANKLGLNINKLNNLNKNIEEINVVKDDGYQINKKIIETIKSDELQLIHFAQIGSIDDVRNIILKNWDNIQSDKFNINTKSNSEFNIVSLKNNWKINNFTPLMIASYFGFEDIVTFLLEYGADYDICESSHGFNAFHLALINNNYNVMALLSIYGINLKKKTIHNVGNNTLFDTFDFAISLEKYEILSIFE
jgi:ankyrin repeat protein